MIKINNKKGDTYGFWIELVLVVILFVGVLTLIGVQMNNQYNQNQDLSFGLVTNSSLNNIESYQSDFSNSTAQGKASLTSFGYLIISTLPHMIIAVNGLLWGFVSGGFIDRVVQLMNLGDYGGIVLVVAKLIYFFAIGFILLKVITKINT